MTTGYSPVDLSRVMADLGSTLLQQVGPVVGEQRLVGGIAIHDPYEELVLPSDALVLGVGVHDAARVSSLLRDAGRLGATALVIRAPVPFDETVEDAIRSSEVALLGLAQGASWAQVSAMIRTVLAADAVVTTGVDGPDTQSVDLFTLANAIAALVDAPITIEDRSSRVLAFSGRQDATDASRVKTILGRQVPEANTRVLTERGVFQAMYRQDGPVHVEPISAHPGDEGLSRAAIAVRAGDEVLGSIWAVVAEPLSPDRAEALREAAKLVALNLLRLRAGADVDRRLRAELVSTAVEGGANAPAAIGRLGLGGQSMVVLSLGNVDMPSEGEPDDGAQQVIERERLGDTFSVHLAASQPRSAATQVGNAVYGIVGVPESWDDPEARITRIATNFLKRAGHRSGVAIGIGEIAHDAASLARSRRSADRALRVLRSRREAGGVATAAAVQIDALMLDLRDLATARDEQPAGALSRLIAYDLEHHSNLVETLRAWLEEFGDVVAASARLFVHPNTFRYRLRRLAEVGELDLTDGNARFSAMVLLRTMVPDRS